MNLKRGTKKGMRRESLQILTVREIPNPKKAVRREMMEPCMLRKASFVRRSAAPSSKATEVSSSPQIAQRIPGPKNVKRNVTSSEGRGRVEKGRVRGEGNHHLLPTYPLGLQMYNTDSAGDQDIFSGLLWHIEISTPLSSRSLIEFRKEMFRTCEDFDDILKKIFCLRRICA